MYKLNEKGTLPKVDQKGIAHLFIILLLLAGIGLGVYLVQTKTNLFPWAASTPISGPVIPTPFPTPTSTSTPSPTATPTATPTPTPTPTSTPQAGSTIKIYAAGQPARRTYPNMTLDIRGSRGWTTVKTFYAVVGNYQNRTFQEFTYTHSTKVLSEQIRVKFINDQCCPQKEDRNLIVDRINLDGVDIQTESANVLSTGTWSSNNGCRSGYKKSEWLHCNGYFQYPQTVFPSITPATAPVRR